MFLVFKSFFRFLGFNLQMRDTIFFDKITMIMPILHQLQINIILAVDLKSLLTTYLSSLAKHFCGPMPSSSVAREMFSTAGYRSNRMNICSGVTRIFRPTVGSMMDPVKVITHQS